MFASFTPTNPPEVFISYAHEDEELFKEFELHLKGLEAQGIIRAWHGRKMFPGDDWEKQINEHLNTAQIFLLLVSKHFLASDYCYGVEFKRAMERHETGAVCVIPVILSPCSWKATPLARFQVLPKGEKPVVRWDDNEEAFVSVIESIAEVAKRIIEDGSKKVGRLVNAYDSEAQSRPPLNTNPRSLTNVKERLSSTVHSSRSLKPLLWILILLTALTSLSIVSGFLFSWPIPLEAYVHLLRPPSQRLQIIIDKVPPYDPVGGPNSKGEIAGRVLGAETGNYVVVIYSRTSTWYVQPTTAEPTTEIGPDGSWSADIQTGTHYAVLLVPRSFQPPATTSSKPIRLNGVFTSIEVEGKR